MQETYINPDHAHDPTTIYIMDYLGMDCNPPEEYCTHCPPSHQWKDLPLWRSCSCGMPLFPHSQDDLSETGDSGEVHCYAFGRTEAFCDCGHTIENARHHDVLDRDGVLIAQGNNHDKVYESYNPPFTRKEPVYPDDLEFCGEDGHEQFVVVDGKCIGCTVQGAVDLEHAEEKADEIARDYADSLKVMPPAKELPLCEGCGTVDNQIKMTTMTPRSTRFRLCKACTLGMFGVLDLPKGIQLFDCKDCDYTMTGEGTPEAAILITFCEPCAKLAQDKRLEQTELTEEERAKLNELVEKGL